MICRSLAVLLLVAGAALAAAPVTVSEHIEAPSGVTSVRLSNGMVVILKPTRTAPVVTVQAHVRAGSMYETQWLGCGVSHLLEHLVADNSVGPGDTNRITAIGGQSNAYTSTSRTVYYISATSDKTNDCIDLTLDQLARPTFTETDFTREHGVVQRELLKGKDEPNRVFYYAHAQNFYGTHPAAVPVIGYAKPLADVTYADIRAYHKQMYAPQNITLAVVGDIDTKAALKRVIEQTQGFLAGRRCNYDLPAVKKVIGVRRFAGENPLFKQTLESISFQTVPLQHKDLFALDVLAAVLGQGKGSRLVRQLQFKKKLVTSISCYSYTPAWGGGDFTVRFRSTPKNAAAAEAAVFESLQSICQRGVTEEELTRVKRQVLASHVRQFETVEGTARTLLSDWTSTGDLDFSRRYKDKVAAVTAEQVQAVAKKYLTPDTNVITRMGPPSATADATTDTKTKTPEATQVITLANGVRVILHPTENIELVSMVVACKGGLLGESKQSNGLGTLLAMLSTRGAGEWSADELSQFFETAGGSVSATCGDNSILYSASVLSDSFDKALPRFAAVVLNPTLQAAELDKVRPLAIGRIKQMTEHWSTQMNMLFREKFFAGTPWQWMSAGQLPVVESATVEQLQAYHKTVLQGGSMVVSIYGKFDAAKTKATLNALFGAVPKGVTLAPKVAKRTIATEGELHVRKAPIGQAGIMVGVPGPRMEDIDDRLALMLLDTIISGYRLPSGWLHEELRGKQLVYVVHAYTKMGFIPGSFLTYAATQPERATTVIEIIHRNLTKAATYTPTKEELARAVNIIVTAEVLGDQSLGSLATGAALNELYGMGVDWPKQLRARLSAITPEQVQAVGKKYLSGGFVTTVVTPKPELLEKK